MSQTEKLLTVREAADFLGVSIYVMHRHIHKTHKLIPDARTRTGELRFSEATLKAFEPTIGHRGRPKGG